MYELTQRLVKLTCGNSQNFQLFGCNIEGKYGLKPQNHRVTLSLYICEISEFLYWCQAESAGSNF